MNFHNVYSQSAMLGGTNNTVLNNYAEFRIGPFNTAPQSDTDRKEQDHTERMKLASIDRAERAERAAARQARHAHLQNSHDLFVRSSESTKMAVVALHQLGNTQDNLSQLNFLFQGFLTEYIHIANNYDNISRATIIMEELRCNSYDELSLKLQHLDAEFDRNNTDLEKLLSVKASGSARTNVVYHVFRNCDFLNLDDDQLLVDERTFDLGAVENMICAVWTFGGKKVSSKVLYLLNNLLLLLGLLRENDDTIREVRKRMRQSNRCLDVLNGFIGRVQDWDPVERSILSNGGEQFPDSVLHDIARNDFAHSAVTRRATAFDQLRQANPSRLVVPLRRKEFDQKYFGVRHHELFQKYVTEEIVGKLSAYEFHRSMRILVEDKYIKLVLRVPVALRSEVTKCVEACYPQKDMRRRSQIFDDIEEMDVDEE